MSSNQLVATSFLLEYQTLTSLTAYPDINQLITDKRRSQTRGQVSKFFTGRREILETMTAYFQNNKDPRREFLLLGMGGVGKTQIALKFAADHSDM